MHHKFSKKADFICIYIAESHAVDEWPMDLSAIQQHKTVTDRAVAAADFLAQHRDQFSWPIALDTTMDGKFLEMFGAWPTRFFGVTPNGTLSFKIAPQPGGMFDVDALRRWAVQATTSTC